MGVTIEADNYAYRAELLKQTPAALKFVSLEPLLGPLPSLNLAGLDWVIVGGERCAGARKMEHPLFLQKMEYAKEAGRQGW